MYVRWKAFRDFVKAVIGEVGLKADRELTGRKGEAC